MPGTLEVEFRTMVQCVGPTITDFYLPQKAFRDRCSQCAAVSWGLTDEGKYYCTSCHNVTDVSNVPFTNLIMFSKLKFPGGMWPDS